MRECGAGLCVNGREGGLVKGSGAGQGPLEKGWLSQRVDMVHFGWRDVQSVARTWAIIIWAVSMMNVAKLSWRPTARSGG